MGFLIGKERFNLRLRGGQALARRGGVQRIFVGNLKAGEHAIDAFFTGRGPHVRDYKRGVTLKFDKGTELEAQTNMLNICSRPGIPVKVSFTT